MISKKFRNSVLIALFLIFTFGFLTKINWNDSLTFYQNQTPNHSNYVYALTTITQFKEDLAVGEGNATSVSVQYNLDGYLINNNTNSDITIKNPIHEADISNITLNFTQLQTTFKQIDWETISDNALPIVLNETLYSMSFQVPFTCNLTNSWTFIQYPGGIGFVIDTSYFRISIYNTTSSGIPDTEIQGSDSLFNLTNKPVFQPAYWYQSNYSGLILNTSETWNNTFYLVFNASKLPSFALSSYYYYADDTPTNPDKGSVYYNIGSGWVEQPNIDALIRFNVTPLSYTPTPDQVNLTVNGGAVYQNGSYYNDTKQSSSGNTEIIFDVDSPWFAPITFNVTWNASYCYDTYTYTNFTANATVDEVEWNATYVVKYPANSYKKIINFSKPNDWVLKNVFNESNLVDTQYVQNESTFVKVNNTKNGTWRINCQAPNYLKWVYVLNQFGSNWEYVTEFNDTNLIKVEANITVPSDNHEPQLKIFDQNNVEIYNSSESEVGYVKVSNASGVYTFDSFDFKNYAGAGIYNFQVFWSNGLEAGLNYTQIRFGYDITLEVGFTGSPGEKVEGEQLELYAILRFSNNTPIENELISFNITITDLNNQMESFILPAYTNENGMATTSFTIPANSKSMQFTVKHGGSRSYFFETSAVSSVLNIISLKTILLRIIPFHIVISAVAEAEKQQLILILIAISVGVITSLLVYQFGIKLPKKRRRLRKLKQVAQKFTDLLNIDYLLVIDKNTSSSIYNHTFQEQTIDPQLISGFISAIAAFRRELKGKEEGVLGDETGGFELSYADFKILLFDGEYIRAALILETSPTERIKQNLRMFTTEFESNYKDAIINFDGNLNPFKSADSLIEKIFEVSLIWPQRARDLTEGEKKDLSNLEKFLVWIALEDQKERKYFFIPKLITEAQNVQKESQLEILNAIYNLKNKGIFEAIPLTF
ncbi:MAG: hypothetical protein ACTSO9_04420 [Candidatus Helarchaeota archaeon]